MSGRIKAVEMKEDTFFEIDEISDWIIIEALMKKNGFVSEENSLKEKAAKIKIFLTDSDGCLTDGGMYYTEQGDEIKKFNTRDGMGFRLLRERNFIIGIITGEDRNLVRRRAEKLKMQEVHCGIVDKLSVVKEICEKYCVSLDQVAYVGDDINDVEVLKAVGLSFSVADAQAEAKQAADYVTEKKAETVRLGRSWTSFLFRWQLRSDSRNEARQDKGILYAC